MPLVVHSMTYADSLEGQAHLSAVEREQRAMAGLIEFKQHIVIPTDLAPGQQVGGGESFPSLPPPPPDAPSFPTPP